MKSTIKIMGVPVNYEVPANLTEALALPGASEDLIFKSFLKQTLYHGSYGAIRAKVSELLEGTAKDANGNVIREGIAKRLSYLGKKLVNKIDKEVEGKTSKVWAFENGKELTESQTEDVETETDAKFFLRICAEQSVEPTAFAELIQLAADLVPYDVQRKERSAAEKKANKTHLKIATEIADNGALERVAQQLSVELGQEIDVSGDREDAINNLALAIGENERREAEVRKNKYKTMGA